MFFLFCASNTSGIKKEKHSIYNEAFFEALFRSNYGLLFSLGFRMSADAALTKDVIQSLFLELWEKRHQINAVMHWKAYLRKSFYRKMLLALKKRQLLPAELPDNILELSTPSYEQLLVNFQIEQSRQHDVQQAMDQLPTKEREMLQLRFKEGLSYEEIAENTGKSKQTVYNQIYTAIKKLKGSLLMIALLV